MLGKRQEKARRRYQRTSKKDCWNKRSSKRREQPRWSPKKKLVRRTLIRLPIFKTDPRWLLSWRRTPKPIPIPINSKWNFQCANLLSTSKISRLRESFLRNKLLLPAESSALEPYLRSSSFMTSRAKVHTFRCYAISMLIKVLEISLNYTQLLEEETLLGWWVDLDALPPTNWA